MAASQQILARLGVKLALDMAEFSSDVNKAVDENKKLKSAIEREMKAATKEVDRLKFATEDYGKEVSNVTKMQRELMEGGKYGNAAKASKAFADAMLKEAAALDAVADAQKKANAAKMAGAFGGGKLSTYQMQALSYQTTDIITSLAGGQNPMLVLLQQGGQLRDQFGGVTNVFKAFKEVLTPMRIGLLGIGSAIGIVGYAFYQGQKEMQAFRDGLILTNNYAGVTRDSFDALARTVSKDMNVGIRDSKDILMQLVTSGKFTTDTLLPVSEVIAKIAKLSGQTATEVAKGLIPSFDGSASSAKKLNEQYNFLTAAQYRQIEVLDQQNKKQESIALTAKLLLQSLDSQKRELGYLEQAIDATSNAWQRFKDNIFSIGREDTITEKLIKIREAIEAAQDMPAFSDTQKKSRDAYIKAQLEAYDKLVKELEEKRIANDKDAQQKAKEKAAIDVQNLKEDQNLNYELRQKYIDDAVAQAEVGENKIAAVKIETAKKMATAALKFEKDILQSGGVNYAKKLELLQKEYDSIRSEGGRKEAEISRQEAKKFEDRQAAEKLSIDTEREKLELYQKNIFLTDTDYQIALERLKTEKAIADIRRSELSDSDKEKYAERERALANQREGIIRLGESLQYLKGVNQVVMSSMTSAFEQFLTTGKIGFKDFLKQIVAGLIRIQAQAMALKAMGILGSIFTPAAATTGLASLGSSVNSATVAFKAEGGSVMANSPYVVGEVGPELFVPSGSGTIIPNNKLASMGNNQPSVVYNGPYIASMNAIDTQSATQFLAKNKMAVWSANQSATRSIPVSR